jgi:hypothetical protein
VRSVVVDLHQVSSAVAELHVQKIAVNSSLKMLQRDSRSCVTSQQLAVLHGRVGANIGRRRGRITAVKSTHIACMIMASLRATATVALRCEARLAIASPQLLTLSKR